MTAPAPNPTIIAVADIDPIGHDEAMSLATVENDRMTALLCDLRGDDWQQPTDCTRWNTTQLAAHVVGAVQGQASLRELVHQLRRARRLSRTDPDLANILDAFNEGQVLDRAHLGTEALVREWKRWAPRSVTVRRRIPKPLRGLRVLRLAPDVTMPVSYLVDAGFTRDTWMHRIDLARAVGRPPVLTGQHDGRLIADIVREWATAYDLQVDLSLTGPAGGRFRRGTNDSAVEGVTVDAVEFVRILSGRAPGDGILSHPLPL